MFLEAACTVNTHCLTCDRNHNTLETVFLPQLSSGTSSFFPEVTLVDKGLQCGASL